MSPQDAPIRETHLLLTGLVVGESARWHQGRLWFANWGAQEIVAVDAEGNSEVMLRVPTAGIPISIDWLPDGRLLVVAGPEGKLLVQQPDGTLADYADLTGLSEHTWNEIVVDGRGNAYVNSINFDFMGGGEFAPGILALVTPDGLLRQVADGLGFPNGMVITPDGSTLIVAESFAKRLTAFDIEPDGGLSNRRVWAELDDPPDGIGMDAEGAIWAGGMNRCVRIGEGGELLEAIELDRSCFACALGGADGRTLFMMAAEWRGPEHMFDEPLTGQVHTTIAPAPRAGQP
jgi:sugar lactone lactonase YvrE